MLIIPQSRLSSQVTLGCSKLTRAIFTRTDSRILTRHMQNHTHSSMADKSPTHMTINELCCVHTRAAPAFKESLMCSAERDLEDILCDMH